MDNKKTETKTKPAFSMSDFNITDKSEEGVKINLFLPDGTETGHYLTIRGADSPSFKRAHARVQRENLKILKLQKGDKEIDPGVIAQKQARIHTRMVAALVIGWSFDQEATQENVIAFLETAPQIQEQVDQAAGERTNFFKKP